MRFFIFFILHKEKKKYPILLAVCQLNSIFCLQRLEAKRGAYEWLSFVVITAGPGDGRHELSDRKGGGPERRKDWTLMIITLQIISGALTKGIAQLATHSKANIYIFLNRNILFYSSPQLEGWFSHPVDGLDDLPVCEISVGGKMLMITSVGIHCTVNSPSHISKVKDNWKKMNKVSHFQPSAM